MSYSCIEFVARFNTCIGFGNYPFSDTPPPPVSNLIVFEPFRIVVAIPSSTVDSPALISVADEKKMLSAISVENYRTFGEETRFELAPITILLGANSSGKSSITRLFPLLAQSFSTRLSAPLLWVSDVLDYGSFIDNVHRHNPNSPIRFGFEGRINRQNLRRIYSPIGPTELVPGEFKYRASIMGDRDSTSLCSIEYDIYGENVVVQLGSDERLVKVTFRGKEYSTFLRDKKIMTLPGLFPTFYSVDKENAVSVAGVRECALEVSRILQRYSHASTSNTNIIQAISGTSLGRFDDTLDRLHNRLKSLGTLYKNFSKLSDAERERIWVNLFLSMINPITSGISQVVNGDISSGSYLAPVRAQANRYYRRQELAVDQIDPAGGNLAMYLNSLGVPDLHKLNEDLSDFFDHKVQLHRGDGHISVRLEEEDGGFTDNLADVGFGFSQLIPVLAQVHAARRNSGRGINRANVSLPAGPRGPVLAVEQPELHLHPAYQTRLGSYFVNEARKFAESDSQCRFVLETHSEPLVNEVASLVGRGLIPAESVRLYLFERQIGSKTSRVFKADIQPDGTIPNWPFGFFTSGKIGSRA